MKNYNAIKINEKLGTNIFNESNTVRLEVNKFSKKEIKRLMIDDLVDPDTKKGTERLSRLVKEILFNN